MRLVITGASSGLGAALAQAYAAPGVFIGLTGRDAARLDSVAAKCRTAGAEVAAMVLDVTERERMATWLQSLAPLDMVIANAGVSAGTGRFGESEEQVRRIFAINLEGVLNTIYPALEDMKQRKSGHLVIMSSLAGYRGMPGAPAYGASKGAVRMLGEALQPELAPQGVAVTVICPGFIKTPMTDVNNFPMPFLMEVEAAAQLIKRRLVKKPAQIVFPFPLYLLTMLVAALPVKLGGWLLSRAPKKPAGTA